MIDAVERVLRSYVIITGDSTWCYADVARKVVEAMREPTPEMLAVGEISESNLHLIWTRMIDAALAKNGD